MTSACSSSSLDEYGGRAGESPQDLGLSSGEACVLLVRGEGYRANDLVLPDEGCSAHAPGRRVEELRSPLPIGVVVDDHGLAAAHDPSGDPLAPRHALSEVRH